MGENTLSDREPPGHHLPRGGAYGHHPPHETEWDPLEQISAHPGKPLTHRPRIIVIDAGVGYRWLLEPGN
jgi:hypothetical protein